MAVDSIARHIRISIATRSRVVHRLSSRFNRLCRPGSNPRPKSGSVRM